MEYMPRVLPSLIALEAFEATARLGSVSRAAGDLSLTQSAVSRHILSLEARLKVNLFSRRSRRLHLTEAGAAYLTEVRSSLDTLRNATTSLMASRGHTGTLVVATLPTFGANWLVPRLSRFRAGHPDIAITLIGRPEPFDFAFERIDCAIHFGTTEWPGAEAELLFSETMIAVAGPAMAHCIRSASDLQSIPLLHISSRAFAWHDWLASNGADDLVVRPQFTVDTFAMALAAVRAELAAAVLPSYLIEDELARGALRQLLGCEVTSQLGYYFVRPKHHRNQYAVKAFGDWLLLEAADRRGTVAVDPRPK